MVSGGGTYSSDKTEGFDIWLRWRKRSVGISHTATNLAYFIDSCSAGLGPHVGGNHGYVESSEMQGLINVNDKWNGVVAR